MPAVLQLSHQTAAAGLPWFKACSQTCCSLHQRHTEDDDELCLLLCTWQNTASLSSSQLLSKLKPDNMLGVPATYNNHDAI